MLRRKSLMSSLLFLFSFFLLDSIPLPPLPHLPSFPRTVALLLVARGCMLVVSGGMENIN